MRAFAVPVAMIATMSQVLTADGTIAVAKPAPRIGCPNAAIRFAYVSPHGVVVCENGSGATILRRSDAGGLAWSEDGTRLSISLGDVEHGALTPETYDVRTRVLSVSTSAARVDIVARNMQCAASHCETGDGVVQTVETDPYDHPPVTDISAPVDLQLSTGTQSAEYATPPGGYLAVAAVRPDEHGVLFWNEAARPASGFSDAVPLWDLSAGETGRPYEISGFPDRDWLAFSPDGTLLLTITGHSREVSRYHDLTICDLANVTCTAWHANDGDVELDPSWAPDGHSVAFVRAPAATDSDLRDGDPGPAWTAKRRLVIVDLRNDEEHVVTSIGGAVFEPRWISPAALVVVAHDELYQVDTRLGKATALGAVARDRQLYYGEERGPGGRTAIFLPKRAPAGG